MQIRAATSVSSLPRGVIEQTQLSSYSNRNVGVDHLLLAGNFNMIRKMVLLV